MRKLQGRGRYLNNRQTGADREKQAADYLSGHGMKIVERNFRNRQGEIDIIGYHEGYLVFVEVKYRKSQAKGAALAAVNMRKQCQICKVADYYRYIHRLSDSIAVRYDVVAIQGEELQWLQNAFHHVYTRH
ncbi:MAG: YraN family protein [Acetatifactor sp.]